MEIAVLRAAGFGEQEMLDVLTIHAPKALSNYTTSPGPRSTPPSPHRNGDSPPPETEPY